MADKKKEQAMVVSQEQIADGIFSMWIHTEAAQSARPGQFISMYTKDATKLLPRPISICEINKEDSRLRVVYRVTGENTGTEEFSKLKTGDAIPIIGPLGNGFPFEAAEGISYGWRNWCTTDSGTCKTDEMRQKTDCRRLS